ncbi:MAG: tyrosine recombinase XerC [Ruminococcaceae bacterium]|nr:tyrosine recombinase XerC [Oscillospiraceae bacterium]
MKIDYTEAPYFLRDFVTYMEAIRGKSKNTVKEYYFDLRTFLRYMKVLRHQNNLDEFETITIDDITIDFIKNITLHDLYEFLSYTSSERLNNANSRARKVAALRSFFKYLHVKAKLISDNPAKDLDSPKIPKSLPKYLTLSESLDLLEHIDGHDKLRDYAIITLFLNCGMRLSELASINLKDIRDNKLTVIGKGNKERVIYLNQACIKAIDNYIKNERPQEGLKSPHQHALFISRHKQRLSVKTIQHLVKKHLKAAGLDETKFSVHKLRHTAATLMYQHGHVDVRVLQEILGHTNLATTQIYTHLDSEQLRSAVDSNPLAEVKEKGLPQQ